MIQVQQKFPTFKILSLVIFSIFLINTKTTPLNAATNSKAPEVNSEKPLEDTRIAEDTPLFESKKFTKKFRLAFISILLVTGTAILINNNKSLKKDK